MIRADCITANSMVTVPGAGFAGFSGVVDAPVISVLTKLSLIGYLVVLALTQTAYASTFMNVRWVMLGLLAVSSTADIILVSRHSEFRPELGNGKILVVYFFLTFGTVIYAENWLFSSMRWTSHAMMLVVFVVSLPQILTAGQIRSLLSIMKYLMGSMVVVSWILPVPENIANNGALYQGAMGNANTMGHVAFISAILFLHTSLIAEAQRARNFCRLLTVVSIITLWESGARSSMSAFVAGVLLLLYFYRKEMRGIVLVGILVISIAMVSFPALPQQIFRFAQKASVYGQSESFNPMISRVPVWTAAYEGFKKRPLLGWGFGADSNVSKTWKIRLTSLGTVERDAVNDFLFMMEGCGVIGIGSYLFLIWIVLRQRPSRSQALVLQNWSRGGAAGSADLSLHHAHIVLFTIPVSLLVLNQFDNTALSAGNLISVTLWLSAGCATAIRRRAGNRKDF